MEITRKQCNYIVYLLNDCIGAKNALKQVQGERIQPWHPIPDNTLLEFDKWVQKNITKSNVQEFIGKLEKIEKSEEDNKIKMVEDLLTKFGYYF
jgi:DNA-binding transcriptional regulator WhiA